MSAITFTTVEELDDYAATGELGHGSLARDGDGHLWLAYDGDDATYALRPWNEDEDRRTPVCVEFQELTLPVTITPEDRV